MSREQQLKTRIQALLNQTRQQRNALAVAEFTADQRQEAADLARVAAWKAEDDLWQTRRLGREAVFLLMVSISHRRFMKFIRTLESCGTS